ncbi:hypothetical protein [uncultured Desulfosarcina sp.]|uniref:hypothetical protein n=1 Tax=uncultured Desulfosarcina sp. TaxID=218289 RepID=UPI0029C61513|nr:hypothetical protein [uncultured Desulfosarcina sp.]
MDSKIKIYSMKDFIRKNASGEIDSERSIKMVRELSVAANFHADHNILIDLRETTIPIDKIQIGDLMKIVMEFVQFAPSFKNKIANLIPNNADRVSIAKQLEACMNIKNVHYKFFTEFEHAIEWLLEEIA